MAIQAPALRDGPLGLPDFHAGDELVEAGPGTAVLVPRGTSHSYWNARPGPAATCS